MTTKTFDSVNLMRELRTQLSQEMEHMAPGERIRYIQEKAATVALGVKLGGGDNASARQDRTAHEATPRH